MSRRLRKGCLFTLAGLVAIVAAALLFVVLQARQLPAGLPEYVAVGSSFAAGAGLGPLQDDTPLLCARSINGYPQQLARLRRLSIVDMSCGGAQAKHLLHGGQFFQGPQLRPITRETRLVTITVGGNDSLYIGDLSQLAARNSSTLWGKVVRLFWPGPKRPDERKLAEFQANLLALLRAVGARAPDATMVVATYPTILPPAGTCPQIGLTVAEADAMRRVGDQLAAATREAAKQGGALLVDMHRLGAAHHACSSDPWTYGWHNAGIAPFHPTLKGAAATAAAIAAALDRLPAAVAAVGQDDASGHQAGGVGGQEQHD